jgi:hypothetical protein
MQPPPERTPQAPESFVYISHGLIHSGTKYHCEYCLSNSYDDSNGNCMCCGAPRPKIDVPAIEFRYKINPMVYCTSSPEEGFNGLWSTT